MRILLLGAAAGGGFPQWNCNCVNCQRARAGDTAAVPRTQSSVAVSSGNGRWFLLNASPDLRQQIIQNPQLHPREGNRDSPIAGVVLTNAEVDHVAGLLSLRESQALVVYATERVQRTLSSNSIFNALNPAFVRRETLEIEKPEPLTALDGADSGIEVEAFAVPGKVPLYLEDPEAGPNFGTDVGDTVGLRVTERGTGRAFYYIPGCAAMTTELADRLRRARLVLFDGTLWKDDEMLTAGLGAKTGQRMGHMCVSGPNGTISAFADLGVRRRVFMHVNNTNPILLADSPERAEVEAAGWEVAHDGMELHL